jgi:hypothetical protein
MMRGIQAISPERFKWLLDRLGLSKRGAARFLGINERTARNYAEGRSPVDPATSMLLEVLVKHKIEPEEALRLIGVDVKAAIKAAALRGGGAAPRFYEVGEQDG